MKSETRCMVTNFDSVEQHDLWLNIMENLPKSERLKIEDTWMVSQSIASCTQLLNANGEFAQCFAGIIRSAYLYSDSIVLPYSQLLDGVFFLALGPERVTGILGQSYKDAPAVVISGQGENLYECMLKFFVRVARIENGELRVVREYHTNQGLEEDEFLILRPLHYSAINHDVTESELATLPRNMWDSFGKMIQESSKNSRKLCEAIALAFMSLRHPGEDAESWYAYYTDSLDAWMGAVNNGQFRYEDQDSSEFVKRHFGGECLKNGAVDSRAKQGVVRERFAKISKTYWETLQQYLGPVFIGRQVRGISVGTLLDRVVRQQMRRSRAFEQIDALFPANSSVKIGKHTVYERTFIRDWYQSLYLRFLSSITGTELISVSAEKNSFESMLAESERKRGGSLVFDGKITEFLGEIPYTTFSSFCYKSRTDIYKWRECTSLTNVHVQRQRTRNIAYAVRNLTDESGFEGDLHDATRTLLIMVVATVAALFVDNFLPENSIPLWTVLIITFAVQLAPDFIDWCRLIKNVHSSTNTIVHLQWR